MTQDITNDPMIRELGDGVFWLRGGDCYTYSGDMFRMAPEVRLHAYQSMFLVQGDTESLVVDTGNPKEGEGV
jgi:hypothetical protein